MGSMSCQEQVIRNTIVDTFIGVCVTVICCLLVISTIMFNVVLKVQEVL